jgi:hypothetical protein
LASVILGVAFGHPALAQQEATRRLAELVPADVLAYLELSSPHSLLERLTAPESRSLLEDLEALADAEPRKQWGELRAGVIYVASQLGTRPSALIRDLVGGGVAMAVYGPDRIAGWIEARDPDVLRRTHDVVLRLARSDPKGSGPQASDRDGVTTYKADKLEYALVGRRLVFASDGSILGSVLDRLAGKPVSENVLAELEAFRGQVAERPKDAWGWAYMDLKRLRQLDPKAFETKPDEEAGQVLLFGPWIDGLRTGHWATLAVGPAGPGWSLRLDVSQGQGEATHGFAGFVPPAGSGPAPLLKPEGTILSVSLYRDWEAVWDTRADLLPAEAQAGLAQLDTFAGQFFGGRDFASGVLGSLTPQWRVVVVQHDEAGGPQPGTRLPGFAVVLGLKPGDEEFATRLTAAFQSFVGLANLGAAQQKAPPLILGATDVDGVAVATAAYVPPRESAPGEADVRYNFSPSAARVGDWFVFASTIQTARRLVPLLKAEAGNQLLPGVTLAAEGEGAEAARLIGLNRNALRMQRMLEKGQDRQAAEADLEAFEQLVERLGRARLEVRQIGQATRYELKVAQ